MFLPTKQNKKKNWEEDYIGADIKKGSKKKQFKIFLKKYFLF